MENYTTNFTNRITDVENALDYAEGNNAEGVFEIDLCNRETGALEPHILVCKENYLAQVINEFGNKVGVNPKSGKLIFTNKRTGETTVNAKMTFGELDMRDGDTLSVHDDLRVAADEYGLNRNQDDGEVIYISLANAETGDCCSNIPVYKENLMRQIIDEYGEKINIDAGAKGSFRGPSCQNIRTRQQTRDLHFTVEELGLEDGDVLRVYSW
ncbi:MAG: hypothetical protein LUF29_03010 [Oscillospiraceae bacterium]|nr:hypothetical protein [Oscillospiraceae bacterium]